MKSWLCLVASYPSGSHLTAMPTTQGRSYVLPYRLVDLSSEILDRTASLNNKEYRSFDSKQKALFSNLRSNPLDTDPLVPVLGIWMDDPEFAASTGKITVFGDSVCLDSSAGSKSGKHNLSFYHPIMRTSCLRAFYVDSIKSIQGNKKFVKEVCVCLWRLETMEMKVAANVSGG